MFNKAKDGSMSQDGNLSSSGDEQDIMQRIKHAPVRGVQGTQQIRKAMSNSFSLRRQ